MAKKFIKKNLLILFFFVNLFATIIFIFILFLNNFLSPIFIQKNNMGSSTEIFFKIEDIALNVSNHTYIKKEYDCSEFSQELVNQLKQANISAYCISGIYREKNLKISPHSWVEIIINKKVYSIETTAGLFIPTDYYKLHYIKVVKGFCL